ncbi:hypothetical protein GCM10020001_119020 [Nonomuraea salmonea]
MAVRVSPCGWDVSPKCCKAWDAASDDVREWAAALATELLWRLTGKRFGLCEITLRPCRAPCPDSGGAARLAGPPWRGVLAAARRRPLVQRLRHVRDGLLVRADVRDRPARPGRFDRASDAGRR